MTTKPTTEAVEALASILRIDVNPSFRHQYEAYANFLMMNIEAKGFTIARAEPAMSEAEFMEEAMMEGFDQQDASFALELAKKYRGQS